MMLALKSGPQIAAKVGNPAGLLYRRIWYSVGKSGVLGITEYRQGRPLVVVFTVLQGLTMSENDIIFTQHQYWFSDNRKEISGIIQKL